MNNKRVYLVYKVINRFDGKIYIGCHSTLNKSDRYMGSGVEIKEVLKKYGRKSFVKEILYEFETKEEMLAKEKELVTKEFCMRDDTYNRVEGGGTYTNLGMVPVKNKDGECMLVYKDDPRYLSGELVPVSKGKVVVKDKEGKILRVNKGDKRIKTGELSGLMKGKVTVKDKDNNIFQVDIDDKRYLSGELVGINKGESYHKGTISVKDKDGNIFRIPLDDERYLNGELKFVMEGKVTVRDKDNNTFQVDINDPRYLSGELIPYQKGRKYNEGTVTVRDKNGKFLKVSVEDPRYLSGELIHNQKGIKNPNKSHTAWNKGKKLSEEHKQKLCKKKTYKEGSKEKIINNLKSRVKKVKCLNNNTIYLSSKDAAEKLDLPSVAAIRNVCAGKRNSVYGYKFTYCS